MATTEQVLSNGQVIPEERAGWELDCPACGTSIKYTVLNVVGGSDLFFYSDKSSDFPLRKEDQELTGEIADREGLLLLYKELEESISTIQEGQQFKLKNNVCCPKCGKQFPYRFSPESDGRLYESKIIWIEGAIAYRGAYEPSNKLLKVYVK